MAIRTLSNQTIDSTLSTTGAITSGGNLRANSGNLFVGNGSNTTARIYGFADYEMITGVSGATYLRVSGSSTLAGTLQGGQYILAAGLAYGAVNSYTQIIDGSTGAITGTTADFTGIITASSSSTGDYVRLYGSSGTGKWDIYGNGANLRISDNESAGVLAVDTGATFGGNVGIGVNSPSTKLEVSSSQSNSSIRTGGLEMQSYAVNNSWYAENLYYDGAWKLRSNGHATQMYMEAGVISFKRVASGSAGDSVSPLTTMVLDSSGQVGIGTASPQKLLHVNGSYKLGTNGFIEYGGTYPYTINIENTASAGDVTIKSAAGYNRILLQPSTSGIDFYTGNSEKMKISLGSEIIIGTGTNNAGFLDFDGTNLQFNTQRNPNTGAFVDTGKSHAHIGLQGANGGSKIIFGTAAANNTTATTRMTIMSSGNVGIGTLSPSPKLHLQYAGGSYGSDSTSGFINEATTGRGTMRIRSATDQPAELFFDVNGALRWDISCRNGTSPSLNFYPQAATPSLAGVSAHTFELQQNGNVIVTGSGSSGKMGIGTTAPVAKFEVTDGSSSITLQEYTNGAAIFLDGVNGDFIGGDYFHILADGNSYLGLGGYGGGTTPLNITNTGAVGIGTNSPSEVLQTNKNSAGNIVGGYFTNSQANTGAESVSLAFGLNRSGGDFVRQVKAITFGAEQQWTGTPTTVDGYLAFSTISDETISEKMRITSGGNVGIGTSSPSYNLEIGGTANPKIAIVSNINSATSSLYFGDSDAKNRGQIQYTHFGDFMELKTGGSTRVYIESGINTAYTADGLFNANATPSYWLHNNARFTIGYMDNGSGLYSGAYAFAVKSTDGIPVTGREIGAIYLNDISNSRRPLRITNQGRITIQQTNTSTGLGTTTGWLNIVNGTSSYNIYNYYTGTDGASGCARYRVDNTSPSFFDFYYSTTQVGYITTNGSDIFYANTSDYRSKEDLKSFDGMSLLEQIQVYDFKWKESDNRMYGVVAHELQEVIPQAVVGDKDEEKLQAVDYSKLVPVLIKSIQELEARVKELENK